MVGAESKVGTSGGARFFVGVKAAIACQEELGLVLRQALATKYERQKCVIVLSYKGQPVKVQEDELGKTTERE